jgi:pimeloyl-ACP methyl ester carboxylesterase
MATFVLVHGGWHGGWCWREVAAALRRAGHEVFTPTLTGLGERVHLLHPGIDLDLHIQDVVNVIEYEDLDGVVLVGHSYGGMVISGVAERMPTRIAHLVFLDAFVPTDGQTLFDLTLPERRSGLLERTRDEGDGWRVPPLSPQAFGIEEGDQATWLAAKLDPHPIGTMQQQMRLSDPAAAALPRTFIHCTSGPLAAGFARFADRYRDAPGWQVRELATGHDAMLTAPEALARMLMDVA